MRKCRECGFPRMFSRLFDWRSDGTIIGTERTGALSRFIFLESEELERLFEILSETIGFSIDGFLIQAQKSIGKAIFAILPVRHVKRVPNNRLFRPQWLAKLAAKAMSKDVAVIGFGSMSLESYRAGESMVLRFRNPCLVPRLVGSAVGIYESIEEMPAAEAEYGFEGGDLVIWMRHAREPAQAESRLYLEKVEPGEGPLSYERCALCGVPGTAYRSLEWDFDRGLIRNRLTDEREVAVAVESFNAIQRELEKELGDDIHNILYEAQKKLSGERLENEKADDTDAFWDGYLRDLAFRGLGYPSSLEREKGSIAVDIGDAYNQTLYAGRLAAAFEKVKGLPSAIEWERRDRDRGIYTISARG